MDAHPVLEPARSESIAVRDLLLELRPALAFRERTLERGVGIYLSLYEDEIDARADAFWSALQRLGPAQAPVHLELSDAVVLIDAEATWVARGGACTFPLYWREQGTRLRIATALPIRLGATFSRAGLLAAVATAGLHASYEPNAFTATPLSGWQRLRRAAVTTFRAVTLVRESPIRAGAPSTSLTRDRVAICVRAAFEAYGQAQSGAGPWLLEVSGGFDSTLAAACIPRRPGLLGASVTFPYYEFRFEAELQQSAADALGITRTELDGTDVLPYSPPNDRVRFDEPTVFVTGIRDAERMARFAASRRVRRIYVGHGGDQLFGTDLGAREELVSNPPTRGPFTRQAFREVARAQAAIRESEWLHRATGTFVYDARQDVWVKETFGATLRTPFTDLRVFRSAQLWSRWCEECGVRPDKTILRDALPEFVPDAIWHRRGKVAYDGVWMRGYAKNADHISGVFERVSEVLDVLGVSTTWLLRRVRALASWQPVSDREVLALYAIATWLASWEIEHARDHGWDA